MNEMKKKKSKNQKSSVSFCNRDNISSGTLIISTLSNFLLSLVLNPLLW